MSALGCYLSAYSLGARSLYDPAGNVVATPGTTTGGLQEGINLHSSTGFPFKAIGGGGWIDCSTCIDVPPLGNADIDLGATDIRFLAPQVQPGLKLNSLNCGPGFRHTGRLWHMGSPNLVVYIAPRNPDPVFGGTIIENTRIQLGEVRAFGVGTQKLVEIDISSGDVHNNDFDFRYLDGWNGLTSIVQWGLLITDPGSTAQSFTENRVDIRQCMGFSLVGIQIGQGGPNARLVSDNEFNVYANNLSAANEFIECYGSFNEIRCGLTSYGAPPPVCQNSIVFGAGSANNRYLIRQDTSAHGVSDSGSGNRSI